MRLMISALGVLTAWSGVVAVADSGAPAGLPRYKFTVGEELAYREERHEVPQLGDAADKSRQNREGHWRIWVVDKNHDGSWRLVICRDLRLFRLEPKVPPIERFADRTLAYCDVFPEGRVLPNETLGDWGNVWRVDPCALFIPLPVDSSSLAKGWLTSVLGCALPERGERVFKCSIDAPTRSTGSLVIKCTEHDPMHAMYEQTESRRCVFDLAAGRLLAYQRESSEIASRRLGTRSRYVTVFQLKSVSRQPLLWTQQLKQESERFFSARAENDRRAVECLRTRTVKECQARRDRARELLTAAQNTATLEPIREQYTALLKTVDHDAKVDLEDAKQREVLYSRGPASWELTAFDGTKHRLSDYRGKVVVLDFWFASCGWCIKSYPQIKQIAEKYSDRGVVVFGMNTDGAEEQEHALAVIREMDLGYANLKARPALPAYEDRAGHHVIGAPTLFVLDQTGRIADIHLGYKVDLTQRVSESIDRLLAAPASRTK